MGRIEELVTAYRNHIATPWQRNLAGPQKAIFVVYPPADERRLRAGLDDFGTVTQRAGHGWRLFDFTTTFARWMAATDYREVYFETPADIAMKLRSGFLQYAAGELRTVLADAGVDDNAVVAVYGVACLFGFARVSLILKEVEQSIQGRLVLFFPGEYENNNYRLLNARDGWNYLAVPITLHTGGE